MPTYRNDTETRITWGDKHYISWQPGEAKALPFFVPHEYLGLTLTAPEPYVLRGRARGFGYTEFVVKAGAPTVYKLPYAETIELSVMAPNLRLRPERAGADVRRGLPGPDSGGPTEQPREPLPVGYERIPDVRGGRGDGSICEG